MIAGAAKALPPATGQTERFKARMNGRGTAVIILCDVSSSMSEPAGANRKIDILREALENIWPDLPGASLIAFASTAGPVASPAALPSPNGGTALHLGLDAAAALCPSKMVVISDGRPDSENSALAAAARLGGVIDVIYCGPDSDTQAIAFMQRLARAGGGRVYVRDIARNHAQLMPAIRTTLGLPAPKGCVW
jgi:Mg-chelatase subunit ChlD